MELERACSSLEANLQEANSEIKKMDGLRREHEELLGKLKSAEGELVQLRALLNEREALGKKLSFIST